MKRFKLQLARWGQGLIAGCVQGGATACKAYAGTAVISTLGMPELALSVRQAAAVFLAGMVWHAWDYAAANPLPEFIIDEPERKSPIANGQEQTGKGA